MPSFNKKQTAFNFDAIIIGAGVVGLAIANELCEIFDNVIVIDKESSFGQHVSSRHSGVVHSGVYYKPGSLKADLCVEGNNLIYEFADKNNIGNLKCGKLVVGHNDKDLAKLEKLMKNGISNGVKNLSLLSFQEASKIEPRIKCQNALWIPSTGIIDSHGLMSQLEREVKSKNGLIYYNSEVSSIEKINQEYKISLVNSKEVLTSPLIINSAGIWCDDIARMVGIKKYKIYYCKGDYYKSSEYRDMNCLIYPLPDKVGLGIHTVLQLDGSVSFGPNAYYVDKIDYMTDEKHIDSFYSSINKYLDLDKKTLKIDYSGIRPKSSALDEAPKDFVIVNETDSGFPNLINLIGIESPGLTCSLAIGRYVRKIITG